MNPILAMADGLLRDPFSRRFASILDEKMFSGTCFLFYTINTHYIQHGRTSISPFRIEKQAQERESLSKAKA